MYSLYTMQSIKVALVLVIIAWVTKENENSTKNEKKKSVDKIVVTEKKSTIYL